MTSEISQKVDHSFYNTYNRFNVEFSDAKGVHLFTKDGDKYLDMGSGIGVNSLGHQHPNLVKAVSQTTLWHTCNLYYNTKSVELSHKISKVSGIKDAKVFLCNSGAEATESAIKNMRRYFYNLGLAHKNEIITVKGAFHGRTMATIFAAFKNTEGFEPGPGGFVQCEFNDFAHFKSCVNENTAGIIVEIIQGEGGIRTCDREYLTKLQDFCNQKGILFCADEVQSGVGRSGKFFSYQLFDLNPDIVCFAKAMGGGLPIGGIIAKPDVAHALLPRTHGTTFGGNNLVAAVACEVVDVVSKPEFLQGVNDLSDHFDKLLHALQKSHPHAITEVRGIGMMKAIRIAEYIPNTEILRDLFDRKILCITAQDNCIRFLPPLIISKSDLQHACNAISEILSTKDYPKPKDLLYEGKAKKIHSTTSPAYLIQEYKNSVTAFNNQKMDIIEEKGQVNAEISRIIMQKLSLSGIHTHFVSQISNTHQIIHKLDMIPLEVVCRNLAAGSFCKRLGVEKGLSFPHPIIEFCYKRDDLGDPFMSESEILALGIIGQEMINSLKKTTLRINSLLKEILGQDYSLVDFKLEFGTSNHHTHPILADEISPDSCRIWNSDGVSFDKDRYRNETGDLISGYKAILNHLQS